MELYDKAAVSIRNTVKIYRKQFGKHSKYSITTDAQTSSQTTSYVTYTLHIIEDYKLASFVLATAELSCKHTAENLRKHIFKTLKSWDISDDSSDNASHDSVDESDGGGSDLSDCDYDDDAQVSVINY